MLRSIMMAAVVALSSGAAAAQTALPDPAVPFRERTETLHLEGRRGPSLFRPGFAVGEYEGHASASSRSTSIPFRRSQVSSAEYEIRGPGFPTPVSGDCEGGEAHTRLLWITFERDDLSYVCTFGGGAPSDARLSLALARGSLMERLQQPQRAGEMIWNGLTYRFETRQAGDLPWAGGRVLGYVISRDGVDLGGVALAGLRPTFYLPPAGSPDRDAVAVLTISLFHFQDPSND